MFEQFGTVEMIGFALNTERLAQAERHRQLREAERVSRQAGSRSTVRRVMAQALLAVATWLAPGVGSQAPAPA